MSRLCRGGRTLLSSRLGLAETGPGLRVGHETDAEKEDETEGDTIIQRMSPAMDLMIRHAVPFHYYCAAGAIYQYANVAAIAAAKLSSFADRLVP
jgi:hypothetical protein